MTMQAGLYLLYTLEFDLDGQPVKLYGGLAATGQGFAFALGKDMPFDAQLLPAGEVTTALHEPLGLRGVVLEDLGVSGRIYRQQHPGGSATTAVDLALQATARFPALNQFVLSAALTLEDNTPRLAIVTLSASPALTLTQFLTSVLGASATWAQEVTDQFAFGDGSMYYLRAPAGSASTYTYSYQPSGSLSPPLVCTPGFHISGRFRLFGRFDFQIALQVTDKEIELVTTVPQKIDVFDFISLDSPSLSISTRRSVGTHLRISTTLSILNTPLAATVSADYDTAQGGFSGTVSASLGRLALPTDSGSSAQEVTLAITFVWKRDPVSGKGLTIQSIGGLPVSELNLIEKYTNILNNLRGGGCERILTGWLDGLTTTSFTPKMDGSPTRDGAGRMHVPLKLEYSLKASGAEIAAATIPFAAVFSVPSSLSDLPTAIWQSIVDSSASIASAILSNPSTYKAIALEATRRGGASALARFICRALAEAMEEIAKELASVASSVVAETVAEAAELAGFLIAVALLGVRAIVDFFEQLWDTIKSWFGDDSKKRDAEDKVRQVRAQVEAAVADVDARIVEVKQRIGIASLVTRLDPGGKLVADVVWNLGADKTLDAGSRLACSFRLLSGEAGTVTGSVLTESSYQSFPATFDWAQIPNPSEYRCNAAVKAVLTGFTFMSDATHTTMTSAINRLRDIDNGTAQDFANYLQGKLTEFLSYNAVGIQSAWVYAQSDVPSQLTIGKSYIGLNTRISD